MAQWLEEVRKEIQYQAYLKAEGVEMARRFSIQHADDIDQIFTDTLHLLNSKYESDKYYIEDPHLETKGFQDSWEISRKSSDTKVVISLSFHASGRTRDDLKLTVYYQYDFLGNEDRRPDDENYHHFDSINPEDFSQSWLKDRIVKSLWRECLLPKSKSPRIEGDGVKVDDTVVDDQEVENIADLVQSEGGQGLMKRLKRHLSS